jgi:hypothetical protein
MQVWFYSRHSFIISIVSLAILIVFVISFMLANHTSRCYFLNSFVIISNAVCPLKLEELFYSYNIIICEPLFWHTCPWFHKWFKYAVSSESVTWRRMKFLDSYVLRICNPMIRKSCALAELSKFSAHKPEKISLHIRFHNQEMNLFSFEYVSELQLLKWN